MNEESKQEVPQDNRSKLQALQSELAQSVQSLESNLAQKLAQIVQEQEELSDLFFEKPEEFFKRVFEIQNEFIKQEIGAKQEQISSLEGDVALEDAMAKIQAAQKEYAQAHPDVDTNELLQFFTTLDEAVQKEIEALPAEQIFEALFALKQEQEGASEDKAPKAQEKLPKQVEGVFQDMQVGSNDDELITERY